ncbi:MAG: beta-N-acetylhexosaminidase, partial [Burkholderiaceae bacterium]
AGCDVVLMCNDSERADALLDRLEEIRDVRSQRRLQALRARAFSGDVRDDPRYQQSLAVLREARLLAT